MAPLYILPSPCSFFCARETGKKLHMAEHGQLLGFQGSTFLIASHSLGHCFGAPGSMYNSSRSIMESEKDLLLLYSAAADKTPLKRNQILPLSSIRFKAEIHSRPRKVL